MSTSTSEPSANDVATSVPEDGSVTVTAMLSELDEGGVTATAIPMEGCNEAATMLATLQTATGTAGDGTDGGEATVKSMGSRAVKARSSR